MPDAEFRLGNEAIPSHYHVHILPDLLRGTFKGELSVELELARRRDNIEIHAADLSVTHAEVDTPPVPNRPKPAPGAPRLVESGVTRLRSDGWSTQAARAIVPHKARETVEARFNEAFGPGKIRLRLAFGGALQQGLRGLYGARAGDRPYAFTQLEAADARRFFPCFDEPELKARFTFSVTVPPHLTVVSNNPIARVVPHPDGTQTTHFTPTPKLSTYLCALAVGELEGSRERRVGATPIRVWHVPGKSHLTAFALEAAAESLDRLEKYFGIPYPYDKLDLLAVPDFEAGAMENAGAVFFRETLLLVDPRTITLGEKKRVAEVIAHELAHMWFGNLVTMKWWDDLWLNEAFATWMAFKVVDDWQPGWRMWNNFEHHREAAFNLDALGNTHPIYAEVRNAAQATENFDAITYEKGASVVRMVEHYLGAQKFRAGVRAYIKKHRESNAVAADLWKALESASGQPVAEIVRAWIRQAGFPLVRLEPDPTVAEWAVNATQERFSASPLSKPADAARTSWPVPLVVRTGTGNHPAAKPVRALLRKQKEHVVLGKTKPASGAWYYGNAAEGGFYRPLHDAATLAEITRDPLSRLDAVERMGLVGHQWALVRSGKAPLASFLDLCAALGSEPDFDVLDKLAGALAFVEDQLVDAAGDGVRPRFVRWLESTFGPAFSAVGWDAATGESDDQRLRRASLLRILGVIASSEMVLAEVPTRFGRWLENRAALDPNLADSVTSLAARSGDGELLDRFREASRRAPTPQERRRFLLALADFRAPELIERVLALALTPEVPTQDVAFVLIRLLANPAARDATWAFVRDRWADLVKRLPPMMVARLIEATAQLQTREHRKDVAAFFRAHPVETGTRALRLALERFDVNDEFRRRASRDLRNWLVDRAR